MPSGGNTRVHDVAADCAEVGDEAGRRRPAEAVVVGDHRGRVPAGLVVQAVAEPGVPLGAVAVEAEVVRRLHLQRRLLRAGDAVDERHLGVVLGVVGDGDASSPDSGPMTISASVLLDERADLLDDPVRACRRHSRRRRPRSVGRRRWRR